MVLLHKHENANAVADVAWIECYDVPYYILPIEDATCFRQFTDMELKMLYRNVTGQDSHSLSRLPLVQVVYDLCCRIPESVIKPAEAKIQAEYVDALRTQGKGGFWLYCAGSCLPGQKADLWKPSCKKAEQWRVEERAAKSGKLPALKRATQPHSERTGPDRPVTAVQHSAKPAGTPKMGTAKAIIWAAADKMWAAAGKPLIKSDVLTLRKEIMDHLEKEEGIKRTSCSSELGNWHKDRAPY
jgi:hypothetical protein